MSASSNRSWRACVAPICALSMVLLPAGAPVLAGGSSKSIGVNVVLNTDVTSGILSELGGYGTVLDVFSEVRGVHMSAERSRLTTLQGLPYVASAEEGLDGAPFPIESYNTTDFTGGMNTWNLDMVNVTQPGGGRVEPLNA